MAKVKHAPLPQGPEKSRAVRSLFDTIAGRYDLVNRIMTFGMDRRWRRHAADLLRVHNGALVLDVACGTGDFLAEGTRRGWRSAGIDFSLPMLVRARERGFARLAQADALAMPLRDGSVDAITCGFALRNVVDLARLFEEMARVLKPGGRIALLETSHPKSKVVRAGHAFYFNKVVPLIGGLISDRAAYSYLPRSAAYLPEPAELLAMLKSAGFDDLQRVQMGAGAVQIISGVST